MKEIQAFLNFMYTKEIVDIVQGMCREVMEDTIITHSRNMYMLHTGEILK